MVQLVSEVCLGRTASIRAGCLIYYWAARKNLILLLYAYPKNVTANMTPKQTAQLAKLVKEEFGNEIQDV